MPGVCGGEGSTTRCSFGYCWKSCRCKFRAVFSLLKGCILKVPLAQFIHCGPPRFAHDEQKPTPDKVSRLRATSEELTALYVTRRKELFLPRRDGQTGGEGGGGWGTLLL